MDKIITLVTAVTTLLITIISLVVALVRQIKNKNIAITKYNMELFLYDAISEAEQFVNLAGAEKKSYVLNKFAGFAKENNIIFDENAISTAIEKIIAFTKTINSRDKDKLI